MNCKFRKRNEEIFLNETSIFAKKTAAALWVVSDCKTNNNREQYVTDMEKHIPGIVSFSYIMILKRITMQIIKLKENLVKKKLT